MITLIEMGKNLQSERQGGERRMINEKSKKKKKQSRTRKEAARRTVEMIAYEMGSF
jgi:hypothetical protein